MNWYPNSYGKVRPWIVFSHSSEFYSGVPDSPLEALCNYLMDEYGIDPKHHIIAAKEGNCVALAAGYHLATGKVPVVYMQNSGEGNIINPVASLLNDKVYAIPTVFLIGWRGEPGLHDEPQHVFQGEVTLKLLEDPIISTTGKASRELFEIRAANRLSLIEVKCSIGARDDLGRPTTTALENKQNFMNYLSEFKATIK